MPDNAGCGADSTAEGGFDSRPKAPITRGTYAEAVVEETRNAQGLIDQGMDLQQVIEARPTAEWDEILGNVWIKPEQLTTFIFNSLTGVSSYTPPPSQQNETE